MSTLNVANVTDGTDTVATGYVVNGSAKAWVNIDGSGTISIQDSFSVSSIADEGSGVYTTNISSSFTNINYAYVAESTNYHATLNSSSKASSSFRVGVFSQTHSLQDSGQVCATAFGDLA